MDGRRIAGQRAIVVGGGSGIGLGSARVHSPATVPSSPSPVAPSRSWSTRPRRSPRRARGRARRVRCARQRVGAGRRRRRVRRRAPAAHRRRRPRTRRDHPGPVVRRRRLQRAGRRQRETDLPVPEVRRPGDGPRRRRLVRRHLVDRGGVLHQVPRVVRRRQGRGRPAGARRGQRARRARRARELGAAGHDPHPGHGPSVRQPEDDGGVPRRTADRNGTARSTTSPRPCATSPDPNRRGSPANCSPSTAATRSVRSSTTARSSPCPIKETSHESRTEDHRGVRRAHRRCSPRSATATSSTRSASPRTSTWSRATAT